MERRLSRRAFLQRVDPDETTKTVARGLLILPVGVISFLTLIGVSFTIGRWIDRYEAQFDQPPELDNDRTRYIPSKRPTDIDPEARI